MNPPPPKTTNLIFNHLHFSLLFFIFFLGSLISFSYLYPINLLIMIYKAFLKQSADGCDYTIGCGQIVIDIEADSIDDAKQQLYEEIKDSYTDEKELELCQLYEINNVIDCDIEDWYDRISDDEETFQ